MSSWQNGELFQKAWDLLTVLLGCDKRLFREPAEFARHSHQRQEQPAGL
jgi:hypothetical protein